MYLGVLYHSKAIFLTKRECLQAERERREEIDYKQRHPNELYLKDLIDKRLEQLETQKSKIYHRENKRYFKRALDYWGNVKVGQVTRAMVDSLLMDEAKRLKEEGRKNGGVTINKMLRSLKALFFYGIKVHELDIKNPCMLDFYPVELKLKYIPTDENILAVKAVCDEHQKLLIDFVEETACRIDEAIRFKYEDIKGEQIVLWTRKARNSNLTPRYIPKPLCLGDMKGRGKVFDFAVLPRFLRRYVEKLKQPLWSWHGLRHRRASIWAKSGMPLIEIMLRLGHSNLKTTQGYLHLLGYTYF